MSTHRRYFHEEIREICGYPRLSGAVFIVSTHSAGWSGGAKVLCILHHWGVQLILAYSWARPAILVVGKGREECF